MNANSKLPITLDTDQFSSELLPSAPEGKWLSVLKEFGCN